MGAPSDLRIYVAVTSPYLGNRGVTSSEKEDLISLVREYIDVFAWKYEDMPGLNPRVAMHRLNINSDMKPVKQQ